MSYTKYPFIFGVSADFEIPGQGSKPCLRSDLGHYCENTGSLTHWTTGERLRHAFVSDIAKGFGYQIHMNRQIPTALGDVIYPQASVAICV